MISKIKVLPFLLLCLLLFATPAAGAASADQFKPLIVDLADADLTYVGEDVGDWASYFLSPAGDVNGDGLGDVLVGAPMAGERLPGFDHGPGKAYLILGKPESEWPASPASLALADASFLGCKNPSMTARQLYTAGDVNGDGYDDFLISGWKCGFQQTGKAYLFLGRPNIDWGSDFPVEQADASFLGENILDFASYYVSTAGDVNGDGLDDILITSPQSADAGEDRGKVYLILGRAAADWGTDYPLANADAAFIGERPGDRAGRSATGVGDVNGDGYDDFLIGAMSARNQAGEVYLIFGRAAADWGSRFPLGKADASFWGEADGDEAGRRVSWAGDVNADGLDDFLIGSPENDQAGTDAGKAYLILGSNGRGWRQDMPLADAANAAFLGEMAYDLAGRRLNTAGDVNGDGYDDILIGAPHNRRGGLLAGAAYLFYGPLRPNLSNTYLLSKADVIYVGKPDVGSAGYDLGPIGDFNGDGVDDFLIGAFGGRAEIVPGDAYILLGRVAPLPLEFVPDAPEGMVREWHNFIVEYWEPNGWSDMDWATLMMGRDREDPKQLNVAYDPDLQGFFLFDQETQQWLGPCSPGEQTILTSRDFQLDCRGSIARYLSDRTIKVSWRVRWLQPIPEERSLYAYAGAIDISGHDSGLVELGSWLLRPR